MTIAHRLTNRDEASLEADCSVCGRTTMYRKGIKRGLVMWRCKATAQAQYKRRWERVRHAPPPGVTCAICGSNRNMRYDHDHATGKFRAWLCNRCNVLLGNVGDSTELLAKAIQYLHDHRTVVPPMWQTQKTKR
jgi:ssDNA-binding Zn-finger/Zn-ribbon topoisomerase 1